MTHIEHTAEYDRINEKFSNKYWKYIDNGKGITYYLFITKIFLSLDKLTIFEGILISIENNSILIEKTDEKHNHVIGVNKIDLIEIE